HPHQALHAAREVVWAMTSRHNGSRGPRRGKSCSGPRGESWMVWLSRPKRRSGDDDGDAATPAPAPPSPREHAAELQQRLGQRLFLADDLLERPTSHAAFDPAAEIPGVAFDEGGDGFGAEAGAEHAVEVGGRAAALDVAQDGHAQVEAELFAARLEVGRQGARVALRAFGDD